MRERLISHLTQVADSDPRVVLLTADLGFGVVDSFRDRHPARFFNVGVSEQSMIATATGLAHMGMIPYCYSIATFASLRALEFLRNGPVVHSLPVRIIGVGPGFDYTNDGISHYAVDDLAAVRVLPNTLIWAPSHESQVDQDFDRVHEFPSLAYLRVPRHGLSHPPSTKLSSESNVCIVSIGDAHIEAVTLHQQLSMQGILADIFNWNWITNELDARLMEVLNNYKIIVSVENHYLRGGFGSALLEWSSKLVRQPKYVLHGVERMPVGALGSRQYLAESFMTAPEDTIGRVQQLLAEAT